MYIKLKELLESLDNPEKGNKDELLSFFEDQSKMTPDQKEKDIKKRLSAQTIGIEIEMYSKMSISETESYIQHHPDKYKPLNNLIDAEYDGSLMEHGVDSEDDSDSEDPISYAMDEGIELEDLIKIYIGNNDDYEIVDDKLSELSTEIKYIIDMLSDIQFKNSDDEAYKNNAVKHLNESLEVDLSFVPYVESGGNVISISMAITQLENIKDAKIYPILKALKQTYADVKIEKNIDNAKTIAQFYLNEASASTAHEYLSEEDYDNYYGTLRGYLDIGHDDQDTSKIGIEGKYGVELITNTPLKLRSIGKIVKELTEVCNDPKIGATFIDDPSIELHTGLHLHYGLTPGIKYNLLDMIRLWKNVDDSMSDIQRVANRGENDYAKSISYILDEFYDALTEILNEYNQSGKITTKQFDYFVADKYMGVNFTNLRNAPGRKNTVEFRWANADICKSYEKFMNYINLTSELLAKSFTGETAMDFDGLFSLSETSSLELRYFVGTSADNKTVVLNTTYPGDLDSVGERLLTLSDTRFDFTSYGEDKEVGGPLRIIDKKKFIELSKKADNKNIFVYSDSEDSDSKKSPALNVYYDGKLIGKIATKDIHIEGDSARIHKGTKKSIIQIMKSVKEKYGVDSKEYKSMLKQYKYAIGKR